MFTIEFLWWAGWWWGFHSHFRVQPNYSVEVVLCCVVVGVGTIENTSPIRTLMYYVFVSLKILSCQICFYASSSTTYLFIYNQRAVILTFSPPDAGTHFLQRWNIVRVPRACSRKKFVRLRKDFWMSTQIVGSIEEMWNKCSK